MRIKPTDKLIFLDFDGVLNTPAYLYKARKLYSLSSFILESKHNYLRSFDPKRVTLLKYTCWFTGAKIIPISSWAQDRDAITYLSSQGLPIIYEDKRYSSREEKILYNLSKLHNTNYIILDDENDYKNYELSSHLLYTRESFSVSLDNDRDLGLQPKHL